jgi:alpha-tubulin suppressor-like RCC1 family protein
MSSSLAGTTTFSAATIVNVATANASGINLNFDVTYITGTVTGAGGGAVKAKVNTYSSSTCTTIRHSTFSDQTNGRYRLIVTTGDGVWVGAGGTSAGTYRFWNANATPGGTTDCTASTELITAGTTIPNINLTVPLYRVTGLVKDDVGAAIPGVQVLSFGIYDDPSTTDGTGAYAVTAEASVSPLNLHVVPLDNSHALAISDVTVGSANMTKDFTLARQWRISGTIRRANDLQLIWQAVVLAYLDNGSPLGVFTTSASPDVGGQYEVWVPSGSYRLLAFGADLGTLFWPNAFDPATATLVAMSGADIAGKDFVLPPGLGLTPQNGAAGTPTTVSGTNFYGNNPVTATFDGAPVAVSATTSPLGAFTTTVTIPSGAAIGTHTLVVTAGASSSFMFSVVPPQIVVSPTPAGRVGTITVSGTYFKPSTPVVVTWTGLAITPAAATTDINGSFTTTFALPSGTTAVPYVVTATTGALNASISLIVSTGVPYGVGRNATGALGDGTFTERHTVVQSVGNLTGVTQISAGAYHVLALSGGTVWSWGASGLNDYGQLGRTGAANIPSPVPDLTGLTAVAAGGDFSLALDTLGTVWAWGANNKGQLGDGSIVDHSGPQPVIFPGGVTITAIAAGYEHAIALASDGTVYTWGIGQDGTLGNGTAGAGVRAVTPQHLPAFSAAATAVAAGARHTMALLADGTVQAWGYNVNGEVGDGTTALRTRPVAVSGLTGVAAISASIAGWTDISNELGIQTIFSEHSLALLSDGTVRAWGLNNHGQLGDGTTTNRNTPVAVLGLSGVSAIDAGTFHNAALKSDGSVWTWGLNNHGQLGDGTTTDRSTPVASTITKATGISAGYGFTLALY